MNVRQWSRDLALGARFAFAGGREGWVRLLLTAVGVGLGVTLLLLTTAVPHAVSARHDRDEARLDYTYVQKPVPKSDRTLVVADVDTTYHRHPVRGRLVQPDGPEAPLAPGLSAYPEPGRMVVSPALKELLDSPDGRLLRERLPYRITGVIGDEGLVGSRELAYYAGATDLAPRINGWQTARIAEFGRPVPAPSDGQDPVLVLLVLLVFVVLLIPVAVFVATAVRFGGERRDRRLAALRLVGSDSGMTRRIAAGEAAAGALLGLVLGTGFFLTGRALAGSAEVMGTSVFPADLDPSPALAALVAVAVPAAAVLVTLFALRGVVIEPLGVVRTARPRRRRLWWRLLLPLAGLGMLAPMLGQGRRSGGFNGYLVTGGVALLLVGITALLPWTVEAVVARLGRGAVSWQLAVRRLQLNSGTATRMVNGIAVAVAGAIALQMVFAGVEATYTRRTGDDVRRAQMRVLVGGADLARVGQRFAATEGVTGTVVLADNSAAADRKDGAGTDSTMLTIGNCAALREVGRLPSCHDGDVFTLSGDDPDTDRQARLTARPGRTLWTEAGTTFGAARSATYAWRVPDRVLRAQVRDAPDGIRHGGLLVTPGALPDRLTRKLGTTVFVSLDPSAPDVYERVRNTAAALDPAADAEVMSGTEEAARFTSVRTGLLVGAVCVLALIGASLLVSQLEQLRERRKLLSALVAFGTRRRTLGLSVLWQTALPVVLGLVLAWAVGVGLGTVLLKMVGGAVRVDWPRGLELTGAGAGVVLAVTLLSLPPLLRLARPEGLRTE
ncbi:ABC transporter permease [Streptomyces sp. J2-1]|uniref:ABC transporter permease n=1 Tax=Streptomyces corallincola TaxID=2851888 RepID=UPI001C381E2C|nr:FtsX-like permease family protein [Streptomyces corallincola]MBV2357688.1 ABC transporter permease [Streptomyces corallincola]